MADSGDEIPATSSDVAGENAAEGDPSDKREESREAEEGEAEKKLGEAKDSKEEGKDAETHGEAKRRKNCPAALERSPSDRGFSFSFAFDAGVCHNDSTPKFGSFNFGNGAEQGPPPAPDFAGTPVGTRLGGFLEKEEAHKEKIVADSVPVVREERKRKSTCS